MPRHPTIPRVCRQCGTDFLALSQAVKRGRAIFCSPSCSRSHPRASLTDAMLLNDGAASIPLRTRDGSARAYVFIDAADAVWASRWRWSLDGRGYASRGQRIGGRNRSIKLHRELLGLPRIFDGREGDHIDRDILNCRRSNLRAISRAGNHQNVRARSGTASTYRGVTWDRRARKWKASVTANGKHTHLGLFTDEHAAGVAAKAARAHLMPYATD